MVNPKINYIMEVLMIVFFVFVAITSIFVGEGDEGGGFFGEGIIELHHAVGIALLVLMAVHILLHLKFIAAMTKNLFKRKA